MLVKTGYGYIKDKDGKIVAKYDLPKGKHPATEGYTYHEVATKEELDKIKVYQEPIIETEEQKQERLIQQKIREMAIAELRKEGRKWREIAITELKNVR
ncbi:MAG TPA: hypothetical protein ENN27_02110 [Candidatus Atribacteria bacterium]|nr:hypothetical protein [Candidatus Atribacteria bacterium]